MEKTIYYVDNRFSIKVLSGETMIYDSANDLTHFLNPTAVKILELAFEGKRKKEIEEAVPEYFDIKDSAKIHDDIENARRLFKENKLIK